jgi:hypothetical protein
MVTLRVPVVAALLGIGVLGSGASNVNDAVNEFTCHPVVNTTRRCVQMPDAALERTALDDVHTVRSLVLPPTRERTLSSECPACDPSTVTLIAPVAAVLLVMTLLGATALYVNAAVTVLTCHPVVRATRRCAHTPLAALHRIVLSETQDVWSFMLPPRRDTLL